MRDLLSLEEEEACLKQVAWPSHEPLQFMRRRGGMREDYEAYYERYHRPENVKLWAKLMGKGGILRLHFFKGMGLESEREEIERTKEVARIMKAEGLRVSVYVGGTMHTETFYKEMPEARAWECLDNDGRPITYQGYQLWRHFPCINNPGLRKYLFRVLDIAIDEIGVDEVFFDNQIQRAEPRSCRCAVCRRLFPQYVEKKYPPEIRLKRFGHPDVSGIAPPLWSQAWAPGGLREIKDPVIQEWIDFRCHMVHDFFETMRTYIQGKKPATSVGINVKGLHAHNICFNNAIDHGRFRAPGFNCCDAGLYARIGPHRNLLAEFRAYKITHTTGMGQSSQGSELDNLICITMNRELEIPGFGRRPTMGGIRLFGKLGRFLREHEDELYGTRPIISDVAVLRSFASMAYNGPNWLYGPYICEQGLWEAAIPFGIVFDQNLDDLSRFRVLLLANQDALGDRQVEALRAFVERGGGLVATGESGALDDWRRPRTTNALTQALGLTVGGKAERVGFGQGRAAYIPKLTPRVVYEEDPVRHQHGKHEDAAPPKNWKHLEDALRWAAGGRFRFEVKAPFGVVAEFREGPTPRDRAVHLLNYRDKPAKNIRIAMRTDGDDGKWKLEVLSPGKLPGKKPALTKKKDRVEWTLGGFERYAVCVLRR